MQMSLLDIAVKKCGETPEIIENFDKRVLIFVGSKGSGKTTLIQRFLDKNEVAKDTLAWDYFFARKSGRSLNKDVCHVWELGGGTMFHSLLPNVLGSNLKDSTLFLMLDLSSPKQMWTTLETFLVAAYNLIKNKNTTVRPPQIPQDHQDAKFINPFPIPVVIVGGKYDVFLTLDPEEKKQITKCLRLVAHSLAASLFFHSDKDPSLVKKIKDVLNHYGFGGAPCKSFNVDFNKPVSVPFGYDSFDQIAPNFTVMEAVSGLALERFKHSFVSQFPQESKDFILPDDPTQDRNFCEPVIDQLRAEKNEELDRILIDKENKRKLAALQENRNTGV